MQNADGYYHSKNWKQMETVAREATQMAEDARRISIVKEREESDQAAKDASAAREAEAQRNAAEAQRRAAEEAQRRAAAETETANAQRQKQEALLAMNEAKVAQQQADAARKAAMDAQAQLAAEKAAADAARAQAEAARASAEQDSQALRTRLKDQLNLILSTRDTARGLIVSMSDVLFDFNQATLKPGTKEKLAKVSGILLAYPTIHLSVEGYTDSVGTDEYNQKLSERRADAVRDYLTSNGINPGNVQAQGLGKANPVASNDTAAGRQQNRRVEMVVSGDVIGQPIGGAPTTNTQGGPSPLPMVPEGNQPKQP
jgi:outer membrane protein OmpA-like peptidoglycan-associated protein